MGQQVRVSVENLLLQDSRQRVMERAVPGQLHDSVPDGPFRNGGNTLFLFLHPANWPAHNIHKCNRNSRLWRQS